MPELTQENFLLYAGQAIETIAIISDIHERAKCFTDVMNKAREFGKAEEVEALAQKIAADFNEPELWELPQSFTKEVKLQGFPVSCLPGKLQEYLKAVASYVQVFPEMAALPLLSVLALCVQGKAVVNNPGNSHTENLNLYTMTIASPGERKTGSFKEFMKPVKAYQDNYNEVHKYEVQEYQTRKNFLEIQKNAAMKGKNANLERAKELTKELVDLEPVHELRLNVSDATPEALAWEMYLQGGKIGVLGDEGAIFDVLSGMYSGGTANLNIFLEAYDGTDYAIIRRTKENIDLKNPLLTIGLMVQPDLFIQTMDNRTFSGRGFIYRFLFSFPDSKAGFQTFNGGKFFMSNIENTNTQQSESNTKSDRTFTQEEVNKIVSERLKHERTKTEKASVDSIEARETELAKKENAFLCKEYIAKTGLPKELLEVFSTDNIDSFKQSIEKIKPLLKRRDVVQTFNATPHLSGTPLRENALKAAFGLK